MNIYQPAQSAVTGILAPVNFANTVQFICSAMQAASRKDWEQSAKLCVQYLAPIIKNRQYNFPPARGSIRSSGRQRTPQRDHLPARTGSIRTCRHRCLAPRSQPAISQGPQQAPIQTDPALGLPGLMLPGGRREAAGGRGARHRCASR